MSTPDGAGREAEDQRSRTLEREAAQGEVAALRQRVDALERVVRENEEQLTRLTAFMMVANITQDDMDWANAQAKLLAERPDLARLQATPPRAREEG